MNPAILRRAVLVTLAALLAAAPASAQDVARRVKDIVQAWRAGEVESEGEVRRWLVECGPAAVPHLCALLQNPEERVPAEGMAAALGDLGDPQAIPTLAQVRTWKVVRVSLAAVNSLLVLADPACVPPLLDALDDPRDEVQLVVGDGLLGWSLITPDLELVRPALERVPKARHKHAYTQLLAQIGGPEAHQGLLRLMVAANDEVLMAALDALTLLAFPEDGPVVADLLRHTYSPEVQRKCALLLGRLRHRGGTRDLIDLLSEEDAGLVQDVHWALCQITGLRLKSDRDLWEQWWERGGRDH